MGTIWYQFEIYTFSAPSGQTLSDAALWDLSQHALGESKANSLDKLPVQSNTQRVKLMLKSKCA